MVRETNHTPNGGWQLRGQSVLAAAQESGAVRLQACRAGSHSLRHEQLRPCPMGTGANGMVQEVYFLDERKDNRSPLSGRTFCRASPPHRRHSIIDRRFFISELCVFGLSVAILPIVSSSKSFAASSPLAALDKDNDGTLDLTEVKDAASTLFDKLDTDSDTTLDRKEIGGHAGKKELKDADPDKDGTLTKDEYLALVEKLFNAADIDTDGTLSPKELRSKAGQTLLRMIR